MRVDVNEMFEFLTQEERPELARRRLERLAAHLSAGGIDYDLTPEARQFEAEQRETERQIRYFRKLADSGIHSVNVSYDAKRRLIIPVMP